MEIDQLRNFLAVAEAGNFTQAAEQIGLSQPALSRSVARLEEYLSQPVFERQTRRVVLTEAGTLLRARALQILNLVDNTKAEICDDGETGEVRVGAIPTIAPYFLPKLLRKFARKFPQARVTVQEQTTDQLLKSCHDGDVDMAILAQPITTKYLELEELFEEELLLVLPKQHPLTKRKRITLSDIEALPFVLLGEAHCLTGNISSFCQRRAFQPVAVERTSQLATVQELVTLDHGVSMIPAMARSVDNSTQRVYRSLAGEKPIRKIAMVWNSYRYQSKLLASFQEILREYAAQFAE